MNCLTDLDFMWVFFLPELKENTICFNRVDFFQKPKSTLILEIDEKIIIFLCQLRNKASNLNAHLMKDYLTDDPHCLHCGYVCIISLNAQIYSAKRYSLTEILWHWCPFQINFILNGSSEYSHNLNCKIISYAHNYIKSSRSFWHFCNIFFFSSNGLDWLIYIKCMYACVFLEGFAMCVCVCVCVCV